MQASALSRSGSVQLAAATNRTLASGASPCACSTSSVSSPYQPGASHSSAAVSVKVLGRYCWYWPGRNGLSPPTLENWLASVGMVGEAYASTIATVCPLPVIPDELIPYAPRTWLGVYPQLFQG